MGSGFFFDGFCFFYRFCKLFGDCFFSKLSFSQWDGWIMVIFVHIWYHRIDCMATLHFYAIVRMYLYGYILVYLHGSFRCIYLAIWFLFFHEQVWYPLFTHRNFALIIFVTHSHRLYHVESSNTKWMAMPMGVWSLNALSQPIRDMCPGRLGSMPTQLPSIGLMSVANHMSLL